MVAVFSTVASLIFSFAPSPAVADPLPPNLIALDSPEGERLLAEAEDKQDFFPLVRRFVSQEKLPFCGVASSVMVLNAMPIAAPEAQPLGPYHTFTQENVFEAGGGKQGLPSFDSVSNGGMTLDQLTALLATWKVDARGVHAGDSTVEAFRRQAAQNLAEPDNYVIVNFMRSSIGQEPPLGGHWSPLGAYDKKADRFLVLDVARFRYPPFWVTTDELWKAMDTRDLDGGKTRGYVTVSVGTSAAPPAAPPSLGHRVLLVVAGVFALVFLLGALAGALVTRARMLRRSN